MNTNQLNTAPGIDPLDEVVAAQAGAKPAAASNISAIIADELNPRPAESFDPAIHESDPATKGPLYNKDGSLRRKRGRRPGQQYDSIEGAGGAIDDEPFNEPRTVTPEQAMAEAKLCSSMGFSTLESLLGDEWQPDDDERDGINAALAEYIRTTGGIGLPPWATVAMAVGAYAARRTRVGQFFGLQRADSASRRLPPTEAAIDDEPAPEPVFEMRMPDPVPLNPVRGTSRSFRPEPVAREVA